MDGGACWATIHGVTKSGTRLSNFTFFLSERPGDIFIPTRSRPPVGTGFVQLPSQSRVLPFVMEGKEQESLAWVC